MTEIAEFQSSPNSSVGCNVVLSAESVNVSVSILTQLISRVQRQGSYAHVERDVVQSSPNSSVGCNDAVMETCQWWLCFNPHPTHQSGATTTPNASCFTACRFQSSPNSSVGCNGSIKAITALASVGFNPHPTHQSGATPIAPALLVTSVVSILTQLISRVQRTVGIISAWYNMSFNPHPTHQSGATYTRRSCQENQYSFNPHPTHQSGATRPVRSAPRRHTCFNPHPTHQSGATVALLSWGNSHKGFNPHPTHQSGATSCLLPHKRDRSSVSILTQLISRVQHFNHTGYRCALDRFNPHPTHQSGAT